MALPILFSVQPPQGIEAPFHGRNEAHDNPDFNHGAFGRAVAFREESRQHVNENAIPQGFRQSAFVLTKELDLDTPFFKECCRHAKIIPEIKLHFFHSLMGDVHPVNYLTITLQQVTVVASELLMLNCNTPEGAAQPYLEKVELRPRMCLWEYKRAEGPMAVETKASFALA